MLALWSVNYVAGKIALRHLGPATLISFRFQISALLMLSIYFSQKRRLKLRKGDLWTFAYLSVLGVAMNQGLFTLGLNYTTSARSSIIVASDPLLILAMARLLGLESLTPGKIVGMVIAFAGIIVLETEHGGSAHSAYLMGDLLSLGGALGFSTYAVLTKRISREYDPVSMNTFNCVGAAILFLPLAVRQAVHLDWKSVGWEGWSGMLYMAVCSSVFAYLIFYWLIRHMEPSRVATVNYLQPILVGLLASTFIGEHPTKHLVAGGLLVLGGVYLAERHAMENVS